MIRIGVSPRLLHPQPGARGRQAAPPPVSRTAAVLS